jgi:hypothetical protein
MTDPACPNGSTDSSYLPGEFDGLTTKKVDGAVNTTFIGYIAIARSTGSVCVLQMIRNGKFLLKTNHLYAII